MCFSAPVSFIASGGLATIGVASYTKAKKGMRLLTAIPFLFAIQQLFEGLQWLADKPSTLSHVWGYGFLFFAFLVWPIYFPYLALRFETNETTKKFIKGFLFIGYLTSLYLLVILSTQPMVISVVNKSIAYNIDIPFNAMAAFVYVLAGTGSLLISSHKFLRLFGAAMFMSAVLAWIISSATFTSTWCFFGAILSMSLYFFIKKQK